MYGVLVDDLYKENPEGYENLARRLVAVYESTWKHEDFMAAATEFEKMEKAGTMTPEDVRSYGVIHEYMMTICRRKAVELYDRAMELSKEDADLFYRTKRQKIILRANVGEGQACIDEQKQAVKDAPGNAEEYTCLVSAYYWAKQYEECYTAVKNAIAKFPEEASLYGFAGDTCRELKKYDEAFVYWEKHLELEPKWLDSLHSIAFCYEELGEYEKACGAWTRIAKILQERGLDVDSKWPLEMAEKCKEKMGK